MGPQSTPPRRRQPAPSAINRVLVSTGEVSGDRIGARLARELQRLCPGLEISGLGGARMEEAGVRLVWKTNHLGSVGLTEPLRTLPDVFRAFAQTRAEIRSRRPECAVLIGHEAFHLFLARWLQWHKIPTISYFPPQVWLWRSLAQPIARSFDLILTSFPEEQEVYRRAGGKVAGVGHYLCDAFRPVGPADRDSARREIGLERHRRVVGLLPGSRLQEVKAIAPVLLQTAGLLLDEDPSIQFILPVADDCVEPILHRKIAQSGVGERLRLSRDSRQAISASDVILVCSGTATLEAMLLGVPMMIVYCVSRPTLAAVKLLIQAGAIRSETIGLPNLLAGYDLVPEYRQQNLSASSLSRDCRMLLNDSVRQAWMRQEFARLRLLLGPGGSLARAAAAILARAGLPCGADFETLSVATSPR